MRFKTMFSPVQVGPMTVKNRFVVPPMGNNFANTDGTWSDQSVAYYAERAMKADVDAVEVHMAHGYLVSTFMSPRTNKRLDEFGGNFENRMRFPRLIVEEIKKSVGDKVAVIARINSADEVLGGLDVHDSAAIAAYLEECGVDALHVSRAVHIRDEYMWAPTTIHGGFSADLVTEIKRAVTIPVITVGRYTEPQFAELMVKQGRTDLVAFGRQSLADPHMPKKAQEERLEDMIPCIACLQGCVANMYKGEPICCLANPFLGHEAEGLGKAGRAKKVMVIGGGVAGLVSAFLCAERGHEVTLYEGSGTLGGNMRLAAYPPGKGDITNMIRSYIARCEKDGVKIVIKKEVDFEFVKAEKPDAVIVATGSKTLILPIEGIDNPAVIHGSDLLSGKRAAGRKVLVVGGGMVGCETAAFLGEQKHEVTVIEFRDTVGADVITEHRKYLMKDFEEYKIQEITSAKVCRFYDDGVEYESPDGSRHEARGFDSVILSMGFRNYNPFAEQLEELGQEVYVVGDAARARRALDATKEAYAAAAVI